MPINFKNIENIKKGTMFILQNKFNTNLYYYLCLGDLHENDKINLLYTNKNHTSIIKVKTNTILNLTNGRNTNFNLIYIG